MMKALRILYFCLYGVLVAGIFYYGLHGKAHAGEDDRIFVFKAGPEKVRMKQTGHVKTNFHWNKKYVCPCTGDGGPCIQSFLDPAVSEPGPRYSRLMEAYYGQSQIGENIQGAGQVPYGVRTASVQLFVIPFCGQTRNTNKS